MIHEAYDNTAMPNPKASLETLRKEALKHAGASLHWLKKTTVSSWYTGHYLIACRDKIKTMKSSKITWGDWLEDFSREVGYSETYLRGCMKIAEEFKTPEEVEGYTITQAKRIAYNLPIPESKPPVVKSDPKPEPVPPVTPAPDSGGPKPPLPPVSPNTVEEPNDDEPEDDTNEERGDDASPVVDENEVTNNLAAKVVEEIMLLSRNLPKMTNRRVSIVRLKEAILLFQEAVAAIELLPEKN